MKSVLIVDDEFDIADTLELVLQEEGFATRIAYDGRQALHALEQQVPDVVLTDLMMPHVTGVELIRAMRADPRLTHVPVVAMTAALPGDELGAWRIPVLRKPFMLREMLDAVHEVLARASPEAERP